MGKFRCPRCGAIFEGQPNRCPRCNVLFKFDNGNPNAPFYAPKEEKVEEKKEPEVIEKVVEVPVEVEKVVEVPKEVEKLVEVEKPVAIIPEKTKENTYFDGKTCQYFGWSMLGLLITIPTLGILYPLAYAWLYKWRVSHTVVNGYRLKFDGHAGSLIGRWILYELLSIITLTIFAWFVPVRINKWATARTTMVFDKPVEEAKKEEAPVEEKAEEVKEETPAEEAK